MERYAIGIDPGLSGGIALVGPNGLESWAPMPTVSTIVSDRRKTAKGKTRTQRELDVVKLFHMLKSLAVGKDRIIICEKVQGLARDSGMFAFRFGEVYGSIITACKLLGETPLLVPPNTWQAVMLKGYPTKIPVKERARLAFSDRFGRWDSRFKTKEEAEGPVDAALVAEYGRYADMQTRMAGIA